MFNYRFALENLCSLTDLSKRTIRYYIRLNLVPRPLGYGRASCYVRGHLENPLKVKTLSSSGVSLDRFRELLAGGPAPVPPKTRRPGSVEVRRHPCLAPGPELTVWPDECGLSEERLREFIPRPFRVPGNRWPIGHGGQGGHGGQAPLTWFGDAVDFSLNLDPHTLKQVGESLRDPYNIDIILKTFNKATIGSKKIPKARGRPARRPGWSSSHRPKKTETTTETFVAQGYRPIGGPGQTLRYRPRTFAPLVAWAVPKGPAARPGQSLRAPGGPRLAKEGRMPAPG
ncbi:MAG: MerR family transcriptional regulator [Deltaproteobacteria bacterium]|nr:MerR family transcriptional regulator [Deltaproteobacteria bacterium]